MSVDIGIYMVDWKQLAQQLAESEDPLEDVLPHLESFDLPSTSLAVQADFLEAYTAIADELSPGASRRIGAILNVFFHTWPEVDGIHLMDLPTEFEFVDATMSPASVRKLAELWREEDLQEVSERFAEAAVDEAEFLVEYLKGYGDALLAARDSGSGILVATFG